MNVWNFLNKHKYSTQSLKTSTKEIEKKDFSTTIVYEASKYYDRCWDKTQDILTKQKIKMWSPPEAKRFTKASWSANGINEAPIDDPE